MTQSEMQVRIARALTAIAPEADPSTLRRDASLRDQLDIDSMDFLNFLVAVKDAVGVEVPEADYAQVASLDDCVRYLAARQRP